MGRRGQIKDGIGTCRGGRADTHQRTRSAARPESGARDDDDDVAAVNGIVMLTTVPGAAVHAEIGVPPAVVSVAETTDESSGRCGSTGEMRGKTWPELTDDTRDPEQG